MNWTAVFGAANLWALVGWAVLAFLPRKPLLLTGVLYLIVFGLCLTYAGLLAALLSGAIGAGASTGSDAANFTTIEGVRAIFASDGGATVGWIHYLAFDLFVGRWIAKDADAKDIHRLVQLPILLLTFLAGPVGLLTYLVVREPRARAVNRSRRS